MISIPENIRSGITSFFRSIWQIRMGKILLCAVCGLLAAAIAAGSQMYGEGAETQNKAEALFVIPETAEKVRPAAARTSGVSDAIEAYELLEGFLVLGTLEIEKIGQELPVITYTDEDSLKLSACYYLGALPGEKGNMVIAGLDFADGSIFGRLHELETGDTAVFSTQETVYTYEVYETEEVDPDEITAMDEYEGEYALTLITCHDSGGRRLIVRCKLMDSSGT